MAAQIGTEGFWGETSDVVTSDGKAGENALISPPSDWPECFKSNSTLKASVQAVEPQGGSAHAPPFDRLRLRRQHRKPVVSARRTAPLMHQTPPSTRRKRCARYKI